MFKSSRTSRRFALTGLAAASALVLAACGGGSDEAEGPTANEDGVTTLTVGATPVPHGQILQYVSEELGPDAGLEIEIVEFDDYQLPNRQMDEGNLDANYFQHIPFLEQQIEDHGYEISHGEGVHIEPYALFSSQHDNVEDIGEGSTIGITSDAGNQPRALLLLEAVGLLENIEEDSAALTLTDEQNPMGLKFEENPPEILAQVVDDSAIDAAIINGNYFLEAGLNVEDALIVEEAENSPYANVLAWNTADDGNEAIQKLDELLHSQEVADYITETWPEGEIIPATASE
ncbi:MetQ/NlpA family ABC transporter substrate-binding protein [Enteractinococcus coprophilus]|uniref:Lipoprotein n=1 Tax=Enteractinococcus coprophilus TaxID=1027633 RepID=A0A543AGA6_9MICC|nr:MetQ/NlpA family ABC transporter substrate-binding protein [Enteractinococcus coprophilus]TQL71609.1 D-methionine transport system substrate-binding protein [Enteractinococcus coprophilus]